MDDRGHTYYVDHNTLTTWHRPSVRNFQEWRDCNLTEQRQRHQQRFLLPNEQQTNAITTENSNKDKSDSALPDNWEMHHLPNGKPYFVNHKSTTIQWEDPRVSIVEQAPLPPGWEMRYTEHGHECFVDHNTHCATFQDPQTSTSKAASGTKGTYGVAIVYERNFRWKIGQFRQFWNTNALPSHIKMHISRNSVFEDSYHQIMRIQPHDLQRRLYITV